VDFTDWRGAPDEISGRLALERGWGWSARGVARWRRVSGNALYEYIGSMVVEMRCADRMDAAGILDSDFVLLCCGVIAKYRLMIRWLTMSGRRRNVNHQVASIASILFKSLMLRIADTGFYLISFAA